MRHKKSLYEDIRALKWGKKPCARVKPCAKPIYKWKEYKPQKSLFETIRVLKWVIQGPKHHSSKVAAKWP